MNRSARVSFHIAFTYESCISIQRDAQPPRFYTMQTITKSSRRRLTTLLNRSGWSTDTFSTSNAILITYYHYAQEAAVADPQYTQHVLRSIASA